MTRVNDTDGDSLAEANASSPWQGAPSSRRADGAKVAPK